ncbi:hypothetical protein GCM10017764_20340 [Sphingobacterium griseoflavum]|uniref:Uncharacterized protein n=2 Tax=Sphingobacterium griseoflavum TaxID=1474952 RepID=A0ABQ3HXB0_9SPHI|nr:hypothetical protein GCM10017764_20340 [Sphingobacterium griseoflavum]
MYGGDEQNNRFAWEAKVLKEGDSIDIQVQDLEAGTVPKVTPAEDLASLKEEYEHLKPELEKRGLI